LNFAAKMTQPIDEMVENVISDCIDSHKFQVHSADVDKFLNLPLPFEAMTPEDY
jgi:hypothetical protein